MKNALAVVEALKGKKGQHVQATWQRVCGVRKSFDGIIVKRTTAWVRSGIDYSHLADVREGIEAGTREPVQGLPWGQWREGYTNYIIDHKGQEYVRLYPATFGNLQERNVEYLMDGKPATFADVEPFLLASEKHKDEERPACFTVKASDILSIAGE